MAPPRKLTQVDLQQAVGISQKQYKTVQWHSKQLVLKQFLPVQDYMTVVHDILRDCQPPDGGEIALELIDFAIRSNIIAAYAFVELPEDVNKLYYIVYASDLYDVVLANANKKQIDAIIRSVMFYLKLLDGVADVND